MNMRIVSFELTMPNRGSWNGAWTGEGNKYYIIRKYSDRFLNNTPHLKELVEKGIDHWHYSWNDGWGANVTAQIIDGTESRKRRKVTKGFSGYDWMVDSIIKIGEIQPRKVTTF